MIIMLLNSLKDHVKHGGIAFDIFFYLVTKEAWGYVSEP